MWITFIFLNSPRSKLLSDKSKAVFIIKLILLHGNTFMVYKTYLNIHMQLETEVGILDRWLCSLPRAVQPRYTPKANIMHLLDTDEFLKGNKDADLVHEFNTPTLQIILHQTFSDVAELSILSFQL